MGGQNKKDNYNSGAVKWHTICQATVIGIFIITIFLVPVCLPGALK